MSDKNRHWGSTLDDFCMRKAFTKWLRPRLSRG